ncbi:MAG: DNA-protecting protein DprA [Ignavibacteriales bacterium CG07_land_8_20_14_0_80_59_12]|nr:MAG: DNA-protecting protein DprA [Ignavibacteriales bacterium CG07_land_8_20_14_0_80_59_12]
MDVRDLLELSSIPGIGPARLRALLNYFADPHSVLIASPKDLVRVEGISRTLALAIARHISDGKFVDGQLSRLNRCNGTVLTLWDEAYPPLLKAIYDPPVLLFARGIIRTQDAFAIALVGTRKASAYGLGVAEKFSRELASLGITIVSGLARGIDSAAHAGALKSGGRTIAVLGSGVDVIYPPENRKLAERIASDGLILSEFPMGAKPEMGNFPRRNRIISGVTLGTVIVESAEEGGAMITARTALDQDREVFAVPGPITEKRSSGVHRLIRDGRAKLVTSVDDILAELEVPLAPLLKDRPAQEMAARPQVHLSLFEQKLYDLLTAEPIHIDALAERSGMTTSDALVHLLGLEFKNLVRQLQGKTFVREG